MTKTVAILRTGITQGGSAPPALFRIFIDDLAGELRKGVGKAAKAEGDSLQNPHKLVADDVIIIAKGETELQALLDVCTDWARLKCLTWKPQKCSIVAKRTALDEKREFRLAGEKVPVSTEARYLGITITPDGFRKDANTELE